MPWSSWRMAAAAILTLQCCAAGAAGVSGTTGTSDTARAAAGTLTARAQRVAVQYRAYGRVQPIAVLPVTAGQAGVIAGLRVVPGSPVTGGEVLATLQGPEIQSLLVRPAGACDRTGQARGTSHDPRGRGCGRESPRDGHLGV